MACMGLFNVPQVHLLMLNLWLQIKKTRLWYWIWCEAKQNNVLIYHVIYNCWGWNLSTCGAILCLNEDHRLHLTYHNSLGVLHYPFNKLMAESGPCTNDKINKFQITWTKWHVTVHLKRRLALKINFHNIKNSSIDWRGTFHFCFGW